MLPIFITVFLHSQIGLTIWNRFIFFPAHIFSHKKPVSISKCHIRSCDTLLVLVNFFVITAWPKVTYRRSLLWLTFQRDENCGGRETSKQQAQRQGQEAEKPHLYCKHKGGRTRKRASLYHLKAHPQRSTSSSYAVPPPQTAPPTADHVLRYPSLWKTFLIQNTIVLIRSALRSIL